MIIFTAFSRVSKKIKCWRSKHPILHECHAFFQSLWLISRNFVSALGSGLGAAPGEGSTRKVTAAKIKELLLLFPARQGTSQHAGLRFMLRQVLVQSIGHREQCCSSCFPLLTANPQEKGIYCGPISGSALHYASASKIDATNVLRPSLRGFRKHLPRDHVLQIPFLLPKLRWGSLDSGKW